MAEDKGVEGTLKEGRGPVYRQRMDELGKLKEAYKIGEERVKDAKKRLDAADKRIAQIERELAASTASSPSYKGEAETAEQRIKWPQTARRRRGGRPRRPGRALPAFEAARAEFRQRADAGAPRRRCSSTARSSTSAMLSTDATKRQVARHRLRPQAGERGRRRRVRALHAGSQTFDSQLRRRRQARPAQDAPTRCSPLR